MLTGQAGSSWSLYRLRWSYSSSPTAGSLQLSWTDPVQGAVTEVLYVSSAGPAALDLGGRTFPAGSSVVLTLAAGGAACSGSIYCDAVLGMA
jgi:hypothetical protein